DRPGWTLWNPGADGDSPDGRRRRPRLGCHARRDLHHAPGRRAGVATEREPDEAWMARAVALAEGGRGRTSPNPMVGAVLVNDGRGGGGGLHPEAGMAHAEAEALAA